MNIYGLYKICFTSVNSRQTFNPDAHELDLLSVSLFSTLLFCVLLSSLTPSPAFSISPVHSASPSVSSPFYPSIYLYKPCIYLCLILHFLPSIQGAHYFCTHLPLLLPSSVLRRLAHMQCFDDHSPHDQTPSTCTTLLSLNYPSLTDAGLRHGLS